MTVTYERFGAGFVNCMLLPMEQLSHYNKLIRPLGYIVVAGRVCVCVCVWGGGGYTISWPTWFIAKMCICVPRTSLPLSPSWLFAYRKRKQATVIVRIISCCWIPFKARSIFFPSKGGSSRDLTWRASQHIYYSRVFGTMRPDPRRGNAFTNCLSLHSLLPRLLFRRCRWFCNDWYK